MTSIRIQLDGRTLHGQPFGPDEKKQIVCIHGWLDNLESFSTLVKEIETEFSGVCLDLTGHGASDPYPNSIHDVTVVDWVLDILSACDHISSHPLLLVGHSLGAGLCSLIAGLAPDRVKGLILLDGLVPFPAEEEDFCDRFRNYVEARRKLGTKQRRTYDSIDSIAKARVLAGDVSFDLARRVVSRNVSMHEGKYLWATDPRLKLPTVHRLTPGQIDSVIKKITCPVTLFKATKREMDFEESIFERFSKLISQLDLREVETGHYPHEEKPQLIAQEVRRMLG